MSKYEVNDKFIIEIAEVCTTDRRKSTEEGHTLYRVKGFNSLVFDNNGLDKLQKYEQPTISEDTLEMERMKALNDGRNEVWELARKIFTADCTTLQKVFGHSDEGQIIMTNEPQEALAKLEAYEKEKNEIKKSDGVQTLDGSHKGVVTLVRNRGDFFVLWDNGTADIYKAHEVKKIGKHIDIQSVLEQIGGSDV